MLYGMIAVVVSSRMNVPATSKKDVGSLSMRVTYSDENNAATAISAKHHIVYMERDTFLNRPMRYRMLLVIDVETRVIQNMMVVLNAKSACSISSNS